MLEERLKQALGLIDDSTPIESLQVESQEEDERLRFAGSPSILVDGTDPFGSLAPSFGLTCRVYSTPDGPAGSPKVVQLADVLADAWHKPTA